jgi:hypothetical protein
MSFSMDVKEELSRVVSSKNCCRWAEMAGFFRMSGNVHIGNRGVLGISVNTTSAAISRKYYKLAKDLLDIQAEIMVYRNQKLRKNNIFCLRIPPQLGVKDILDFLAKIPDGNPWSAGKVSKPENNPFKNECCYRAYLRGAFLGGGSVNDPKGSYHLEIICNNFYHAAFIALLMEHYALQPKTTERKNQPVVYLKEGEQIVDFLNIVGAHKALLDFENIRVVKDVRNMVNRINNCDLANWNKTMNTTERQKDAIRFIDNTIGISELPPGLREVARLRLEAETESLKNLGAMLNPPLSKSGINHRLKKIEEIAENLASRNKI